ncbi:MAG: hypothetical protein J6D54_06560 [Olsenella sp.]|nr:hypothetical protein [Olsenella sp.]
MRLNSERGETLTETLAGILICVLATAALMTATSVASKLNMQANKREYELTLQQNAAEQGDKYRTKDDDGEYSEVENEVTTDIEVRGKNEVRGKKYVVTLHGGDDVVSYVLKEE